MIGRTNVGGGGNTFAFIAVTYPEGSVCTCSDGTRTIRAKGTTGSFVFNIPYANTWTVTSTNGEKTSTVDVYITIYGQSETVTLAYNKYLFLDEDYAITGYTKEFSLTYVGDTGFSIHNKTSYGGGRNTHITTINSHSITNYNKLSVDAGICSNNGTCTRSISLMYNDTVIATREFTGGSVSELDISNVTKGNYQVRITINTSKTGDYVNDTEINAIYFS